jgi:hypothetical protein
LVADAVQAGDDPEVGRVQVRGDRGPLVEHGVHVVRNLPGKISA